MKIVPTIMSLLLFMFTCSIGYLNEHSLHGVIAGVAVASGIILLIYALYKFYQCI